MKAHLNFLKQFRKKGGHALMILFVIFFSACSVGHQFQKDSYPPGLPQIKSISFSYHGDNTRVVFEGEKPMFYKAYKGSDASKLIVEVPGVSLGPGIEPMKVNRGAILEVLPQKANGKKSGVQFEIGLLPSATSKIKNEGANIILEVAELSKQNKNSISFVSENKRSTSLTPDDVQVNGKNLSINPIGVQSLPPDYRIGPEDTLEIMVWKNEMLSRSVVVRPDGKISFPLIGDVVAVGLTPTMLRDNIQKQLKEYMENPVVTVIVQQINSYVVYLMGEIAKPGKYQLKTNTTVLQALTLAGGFTQFASRNNIIIFRRDFGNSSETKIKIRYDDIVSGGKSENIILKPGDTILVP